MMDAERSYSKEELHTIYELGRLFYEIGQLDQAERIFAGLVEVDPYMTAAKIGLGLVSLERNNLDEASTSFRNALQDGRFEVQARLGLAAVFLGQGEVPRSRSLLQQLEPEVVRADFPAADLRVLWEALSIATGQ
jgi:lipopolysaccharide biosynthesis regulator YciM